VHGDSFFAVSGQVEIHDGKQHDGGSYYFLSPGQAYNLKSRSIEVQDELPLALTVRSANRTKTPSGTSTVGTGVLESRNSNTEPQKINYECGVSLYSVGNNVYPARPDGPRQIRIRAREVNTDKVREYSCKF
jgi:hypothetical protein